MKRVFVALVVWVSFIVRPKRLDNFVDFCSINNVSMFLMTHTYYGYYVHGQSPHGKSDVGLRQMHENLAREEVSRA